VKDLSEQELKDLIAKLRTSETTSSIGDGLEDMTLKEANGWMRMAQEYKEELDNKLGIHSE